MSSAIQKNVQNEDIRIISISDIQFFDKNPRTKRNSEYEAIKTSLSVQGYQGFMSVTQRPHEDFFIPSHGGNTTLQIMKELHDAGDERFSEVKCLYYPYESEYELLINHGVENKASGQMEFVDEARYIFTIASTLFEPELLPQTSAKLVQKKLAEQGLGYDANEVKSSLYFCANIDLYLPNVSDIFNEGKGFSKADIAKLNKLEKQYILAKEKLSHTVADGAHLKSFSTILTALDDQGSTFTFDYMLSALVNEFALWSSEDRQNIKKLLLGETQAKKVREKTNLSGVDADDLNHPEQYANGVSESKETPSSQDDSDQSHTAKNADIIGSVDKQSEIADASAVTQKTVVTVDSIRNKALSICEAFGLKKYLKHVDTKVGFYIELPEKEIEDVNVSQVWWSLFLLSFSNDEKTYSQFDTSSRLREILENGEIAYIKGEVGKPLSGTSLLNALISHNDLKELFDLVAQQCSGVCHV